MDSDHLRADGAWIAALQLPDGRRAIRHATTKRDQLAKLKVLKRAVEDTIPATVDLLEP